MTAKEYLDELNTIRDDMHSMELMIEDLYGRASGLKAIRYDKDKVQTAQGDSLAELTIKITEVAEKYSSEVLKYKKEYDKRRRLINGMPNRMYAKILRLRYLDGKRWEEIAVETHYSFRHVTRLHGDALKSFTDRFKSVLTS